MKNLILIFILTIGLSGCSLSNMFNRQPIIETKIIKIKVPEEFLNIPPYPAKIDIEYSTQKEISEWILNNEERMYILERNIQNIKEFNDKFVNEKDIK